MIYLDNAATSWPKPPEVISAMASFLEKVGGNPGRSGHQLSIAAARVVYNTREAVAELLNAPNPLRVIFTMNATHAINLALYGLLRPGDGVVTTGIEHNSVMRPLRALERKGISVAVVPCLPDGSLDLSAMARCLSSNTRLIVVNHASNVTGTLLPIEEIAQIAHRIGALLLVDAAQTAGVIPIDMQAMGMDLLAFTGHKGLQGPPGIGGLIIGDGVDVSMLEPLIRGGTGSYSEFEEQPEDLPDKYESGTSNGVGIAGLEAGVRWVMTQGIEKIRAHELEINNALIEGLTAIPGVTVYGPQNAVKSTAVLSFTVHSRRVSEIGLKLEEEFGILCRVGLHCAPAAHKTIGTFPEGTVRFSPGIFTTLHDIRTVVKAVGKVVNL